MSREQIIALIQSPGAVRFCKQGKHCIEAPDLIGPQIVSSEMKTAFLLSIYIQLPSLWYWEVRRMLFSTGYFPNPSNSDLNNAYGGLSRLDQIMHYYLFLVKIFFYIILIIIFIFVRYGIIQPLNSKSCSS